MRWLSRALARRSAQLRSTTTDQSEDGAIAIIVAVLLIGGVLLGMTALTIDVGSLYFERRQLQNGADAAALAVAQDAANNCSTGSCLPATRAQTYANANSKDGVSSVLEICGAGWTAIPACSAQTTPTITRCPSVPGSVTTWVRVRTGTLTSGGSTLLPTRFARTLAGGSTGNRVFACAQAGLGAPSALIPAVPLTLSLCEWRNYTSNGTNFAPSPPYSTYPLSYEHAIFFHDTSGAAHCKRRPVGS